jgi:hypothetical protein
MTLSHGLPYENAQPFQGNILPPELFFSERIKDSCRLFSGLLLIETNVFVSHGRYLSQYYLDEDQTFKLNPDGHLTFYQYIKMLFKFYIQDPKTGEKRFSVGVFLENGEIHIVESEDTADHRSWRLQRDHAKDYKPLGIPGDILCCAGDPDQFKANLFLALKEKKDTLEGYQEQLLEEHRHRHDKIGDQQLQTARLNNNRIGRLKELKALEGK